MWGVRASDEPYAGQRTVYLDPDDTKIMIYFDTSKYVGRTQFGLVPLRCRNLIPGTLL